MQKKVFDEWINTSNFVYNKTVEYTNNGYTPNFYQLRDILVTKNTKKNYPEYKDLEEKIRSLKANKQHEERYDVLLKQYKIELRQIAKGLNSTINTEIKEWELRTPKDIRAGAVHDVCKAYKTAFTNLRQGNIKHFSLHYRKKTNSIKSIVLPSNLISICRSDTRITKFRIAPTFLKDCCEFVVGKKTLKKHKDLTIEGDCRLLKKNNDFWLILPIAIAKQEKNIPLNYCGVDPGVRTFMTTFGNNGICEYKHDKILIDKLNKAIFYLKSKRFKNKRKGLNKRETKKENVVNELHWKTINSLLSSNDVVLYGDIKSHNIVKKSFNTQLNQGFNDLKFYKFKERLLYKASLFNKQVFLVNEAYTSQTCSFCGSINKPGTSKTYHCTNCCNTCDRDINASKNILIKGIINYL